VGPNLNIKWGHVALSKSAMAANNRSSGKSGAGRAVARELDQLKKKVKELALRLEHEAKARELAARLAEEAKKAREQLTREIKALREQGRKMASELKSAITDAKQTEANCRRSAGQNSGTQGGARSQDRGPQAQIRGT
jgi:chromosome segregation ATPase